MVKPKMTTRKRAVVLVSGGLDSATALAVARHEGYDCYALSIDYGQRHHVELQAARRVCAALGVARHVVIPLNLREFGGSALTDDLPVPKDRSPEQAGNGIPSTYVPARNTIFLSLALGWAEVLGAADIWIGVNAVDFSGYPDCRPEFIRQFEELANVATRAGVEGTQRFTIRAPLINLTKAQIIDLGQMLGVDYSLTTSCYDPAPDGTACGCCDACLIRRRGFFEAGLPPL